MSLVGCFVLVKNFSSVTLSVVAWCVSVEFAVECCRQCLCVTSVD